MATSGTAGTVRSAVEAIWTALGVGVPPEVIGARYSFEVEDTAMELRLSADGRGTELWGRIGRLGQHPLQTADQLRRLLRLGLALAASNRAALVLPSGAETAALRAMARGEAPPSGPPDLWAVTVLDSDVARDGPRALQDVVQWRTLARPILGEADPPPDEGGPRARAAPVRDIDRGFVIFQP